MPTRSPTLKSSPASSPTCTTSPTTSWPGVTRSRCTGRSPSVTCRSVRHTPHARTATNSSAGPGSGRSTVTRSNGPLRIGPGRRTCHARIVLAPADQSDDPQQDDRTEQRNEEREDAVPAFDVHAEQAEQYSTDEPAHHTDDDVQQDA